MHGMHATATSKVENSTQGSSCKLKFVHVSFSPVPSIGVPSLLNKTGESGKMRGKIKTTVPSISLSLSVPRKIPEKNGGMVFRLTQVRRAPFRPNDS